MKLRFIIILLGLGSISLAAMAIDETIKKKYPYQLITDDYGILDENDLGFYSWNMIDNVPFSVKTSSYNYWQCFPTKNVSFSYKNEGYSDDNKTNVYDFSVNIKVGKDKIQSYNRARLIPKDFCREIEAEWKKLMKGQKYVCFGGNFISHEEKIRQGAKIQVYIWNFNKIKTKKGCDSYFTYHGRSPCGMTYEEYKKRDSG